MNKGRQNATSSKHTEERKQRIFLVIFFLINLFLSSYFIDVWNTPNPVSRALPVLTFVENGTFKVDKYASRTEDKSKVGDHFYSDKAPLPTLLVIPFYKLLKVVGLDGLGKTASHRYPIYIFRPHGIADARTVSFDDSVPVLLLGSFLCGSLPFALIVTLSYLSIRDRHPSLSPAVMAMTAFYGSFIFVFSGTYFNHVFAGLLLLLSYIFVKNSRFVLSGLLAGMSFLSEYTVGLVIPLWAILILLNEKRITKSLSFVLGVLPSLVFIGTYNYIITNNPFTMLNNFHYTYGRELSHHYGFGFPSLTSLWGLSFSASMGLLVFAPMLIIAVFYLLNLFLKEKYIARLYSNYLAVFGVIFFFIVASFFTWWGGWSYGPRYLIALSVLLIYEGIKLISRFPFDTRLYLAVTGYGVISAWVAKSTLVFMVPDFFLNRVGFSNTFIDILVPELLARHFNPDSLPTLIFGIQPFLSAISWLAIFTISLALLFYWHTLSRNGNTLSVVGKDGDGV